MPGDRVVHVVDDDSDVRRSLERLLGSAGYKAILYNTPEEFLRAARSASNGCVLLDVYMPGMDGLEVQAQLQKLGSHLTVIVMTGHGDVQTAIRAMKAGAVDFIEKPFDNKTLLDSIELATTKGSPIDRDSDVSGAAVRIASLSPREREVLDALVAGKPNKVIAFDLGISVRTIEVHRARMMERLGVRQLAEAVRLAVLAHLVDQI